MKLVAAGAVMWMGCSAVTQPPEPPAPRGELVIADACAARGFAAAGDRLFWISACDGTIRAAAKTGGASEVLATGEPDAAMLAADATALYWERPGAGELVRIAQAGGAPAVLAGGQDQMFVDLPQQLAVDATTVYRSRFSDILALPKDGSAAPAAIARGDSGPFLVAAPDALYWASLHGVFRLRHGAAAPEQLAGSASPIYEPVAVTAGGIFYWADGLYRIDAVTGDSVGPLADVEPANMAVAFDASAVVWASAQGIEAVADDGTLATLARADAPVDALAVDATHVYWTAGGSVYRAAR